jgi:hypothetical protein
MATEINTWQIVEGKLVSANKKLSDTGRKEKEDLEVWIKSNPIILGHNLIIIGEQVRTKSGPLDLLAIDDQGNTVIVELKRERLPREVIAQAIDYAADIDTYSIDKLSEICHSYRGKSLEETIEEGFPNVNPEELSININQRILLVGFGIEERLTSMIEWLSSKSEISINAVLLNYVLTSSGDELISRTVVIPEEVVMEKSKGKRLKVSMSDEPGSYSAEDLKQKLIKYLSRQDLWSVKRLNSAIIPALLEAKAKVPREQLLEALIANADADSLTQAGYFFSLISSQLGQEKRDYLRQVIGYEYPIHSWEKDNYYIREGYKELMASVIEEVSSIST